MTVTYNPSEGLDQITDGLKRVTFDQIAGLNGFKHPVSAPPLPAGMVAPPAVNYREAMSKGVITLEFELWVIVGTSAGWEQQTSLWPYMNWAGSKSLVTLLDANPTLGIVGTDNQPRVHAHVAGSRRLEFEELASLETAGFGAALITPVVVTNRS